MLTQGINFKNFNFKFKFPTVIKSFKKLINNKNQVIESLGKNYKDSFNHKFLIKTKKFSKYRIIGMGGSTLGSQAIYDFLNFKIKKKFSFIDNLQSYNRNNLKEKYMNLIISKSGNTIETIVNANILIKDDRNIFITENKNNYLYSLAQKLKADIIHHNNYIGGRFSVLSKLECPAELMGLKVKILDNLTH